MKSWKYPIFLLIFFSAILIFGACDKEDDKAPVVEDFSVRENFDTFQNSIHRGWLAINNSRPIGSSTWQQGVYGLAFFGGYFGVPAHSHFASATEYAYCEFSCGSGTATLSCWLISPVLQIKNGDVISFWTRISEPPVSYPDRLQVYVNTKNDGTDVGSDAGSTGDFSELLFDINPDLKVDAYPTDWKKYEWTVSGLSSTDRTKSRIGFRYFVTNGGPNGINSNFVALDDFELKAN